MDSDTTRELKERIEELERKVEELESATDTSDAFKVKP